MPLVSISCVTYNHAPYIRQCLDGFLMQECDFDFEILIHDDASTDGTIEIIKEYQQRYPLQIKPIIQAENQYSKGVRGITAKYNFSRAKGKYIALCEGDDYWTDPQKLKTQVAFLESNPEYVVTHHSFRIIDEEGNRVPSPYTPNERDFGPSEMVAGALLKSNTILFRNVRVEPPNGIPNGDTYLIAVLGQFGKAKYLGTIGPSVYRMHRGGIWSQIDHRKRIDGQIETFKLIKTIVRKDLLTSVQKKLFELEFQRAFLLRSSGGDLKTLGCLARLAAKNPILMVERLKNAVSRHF